MSELLTLIFYCSIPVIAVDAFFLAILISIMINDVKERFKNELYNNRTRNGCK